MILFVAVLYKGTASKKDVVDRYVLGDRFSLAAQPVVSILENLPGFIMD